MCPLQYDPAAALAHLVDVDPRLAGLIELVGPFTMRPDLDLGMYQSLIRSIIYQQLSGKAAATILGRLLARFDPPRFPTPGELVGIGPDDLRTHGISGNKARSLHDLSHKVLDGTVPTLEQAHELDDDELVARLSVVRGIGTWTVQMLLIFRLGRSDVLPVADLGVRKGFARTYGLTELPTPTQMLTTGEAWRPYRSVASWYLWRAVDLPPELTW